MTVLKARPRKTVEDYMKLPEGVRAELIEGEILMSPSPKEKHQRVSVALVQRLADHVQRQKTGRIYAAPFDVHLPSGDIVEPDIIFVATANASIIQDWIRGVPDLLIEIVSPEGVERDRIVKRDLYARNGVKEYWIVDPEAESVEVLCLSGDRYEPGGYFRGADTLVSPGLTDLALPVAPLFR